MYHKIVSQKGVGVQVLSYVPYSELLLLENKNRVVKKLMKNPQLWLFKLKDSNNHSIQEYIKNYKIAPKHFRKLYTAKYKLESILREGIDNDFYTIHSFEDMIDYVCNIFKFYKVSKRESKYMFIFLKNRPTRSDLKIAKKALSREGDTRTCLQREKRSKFRDLLIILMAIFYATGNGPYYHVMQENIKRFLHEEELSIDINSLQLPLEELD